MAGPLARAGLNVWEALCERKREDGTVERCEHFAPAAMSRNSQPRPLRILPHDYLALRHRLAAPTVQIVDEAFHAKLARRTGFALDRLTAARAWRGRHGRIALDKLAELDAIGWQVRRALEAGRHPRDAGVTAEDAALAAKIEIATADGAPVSPGMTHEEQRRRVAAMQRSEALKLWRFWRVLGGEIGRDGPLQRIRLVRDVPREGELEDRIELFWRAELKLRNVPTLVIDADLDPVDRTAVLAGDHRRDDRRPAQRRGHPGRRHGLLAPPAARLARGARRRKRHAPPGAWPTCKRCSTSRPAEGRRCS